MATVHNLADHVCADGTRLNPSEEVLAVAMAKTSRSPRSFAEDLESTSEAQAENFLARFVNDIKYGHGSIADMAVLSPVFENVSTLAAEYLLNPTNAAYQAKSSRYQVFSRDRVYQPFDPDSPQGMLYKQFVDVAFTAYEKVIELLTPWVDAHPDMQGLPASVRKARVLDAARYLLPLGAFTNLSARWSARTLVEMINTLGASPLVELQEIAQQLLDMGQTAAPTLVQRASIKNPAYEDQDAVALLYRELQNMGEQAQVLEVFPTTPGVRHRASVSCEMAELPSSHPLDMLLLAPRMDGLEDVYFDRLIAQPLSHRLTRHDPLPQSLTRPTLCFTLTSDIGTWKDLRRHRRMSSQRALFSAATWDTPDDLLVGGNEEALEVYVQAANTLSELWQRMILELGVNQQQAQYLTCHGNVVLWQATMDLHQLIYITELRTAPGGHISYRRLVNEMFDAALDELAPYAKLVDALRAHVHRHPVDGVSAHH